MAATIDKLMYARVRQLEAVLLAALPRSSLVWYMEAAQYDETPLRFRVVATVGAQLINVPDRMSLPALADRPPGSSIECVAPQVIQGAAVSDKADQHKLVQTRIQLSLVVRLHERLVTLRFAPTTKLAVLERTTAAAIKHLQARLSPVGPCSQAFKRSTRFATTDRYAANLSAEAALVNDRSRIKAACSSHMLCDVHATANVYSKVFAPMDSTSSAIINIVLSLRTGSAFSQFRRALMEEIDSRLQVRQGFPGRESIVYKQRAVRLFLQNGEAVLRRRLLLAVCPNGEWRSPHVEFWVNAATPPRLRDRACILEHLTQGLCLAFTSSQPALYDRHRWTGSDIAVDELGIFEACHRLLSTTYCRFCARFVKGAWQRQLLLFWANRSGNTTRAATKQSPMDQCMMLPAKRPPLLPTRLGRPMRAPRPATMQKPMTGILG